MIHAYSEIYVDGAMTRMGDMMEYAVLDVGLDPDCFFKLFLNSSVSTSFEVGEARVVAGHSGPELTVMVFEEVGSNYPNIVPTWRSSRSDIFWTGWVYAYFQWYTGYTFKKIWHTISCCTMRKMYTIFHEADIMKIIEEMQLSF